MIAKDPLLWTMPYLVMWPTESDVAIFFKVAICDMCKPYLGTSASFYGGVCDTSNILRAPGEPYSPL